MTPEPDKRLHVADARTLIAKLAGFVPPKTLAKIGHDPSLIPFTTAGGLASFAITDVAAFATQRKADLQRRRKARRASRN
jgi:hypothetical protein